MGLVGQPNLAQPLGRSRHAPQDALSLRQDRSQRTKRYLPLTDAMFRGNGDTVYALVRPSPSSSRILKSTDRGRRWVPLGADIQAPVNDIDVDPVNSDWVYAAGIGGTWVFDGSGWSSKDSGDGLEEDYFGGLHFASVSADPRNVGVVYAGQNVCWRGVARGVYRSSDRGRTWRNLNLNLGDDLTVWGIAVGPDGTAWLGTDHGTFRLRGSVRPQ